MTSACNGAVIRRHDYRLHDIAMAVEYGSLLVSEGLLVTSARRDWPYDKLASAAEVYRFQVLADGNKQLIAVYTEGCGFVPRFLSTRVDGAEQFAFGRVGYVSHVVAIGRKHDCGAVGSELYTANVIARAGD